MNDHTELVFVLKKPPHQPFQAANLRLFSFGQVTLLTASFGALKALSLFQVMGLASVCAIGPDGKPVFYAASAVVPHVVGGGHS